MTPSDEQPQANGDADTTQESMLSLDNGVLHVCQDGPRDAPALLLIHGSASSSRTWAPLTPLLTDSRHVIRIDLPGHGSSSEPTDQVYDTSAQARAVATAMDRIGIDHAVAVGHSSGGYTATALAGQRPDLVTALVLINSGPGMDAYIAPEPAIDPTQWPPTDEQLRQFASTGFREGYQVPQELVDELRGMSFRALSAAMQASRAYLHQQALPDRLKPLGKPLQVIFGAQDRRWRPSSANDYRVVPGVQIDFLPEAGHSPLLEDPPGTAALLLAFIAHHAARAPKPIPAAD
ncbi:alpha/beta fold hydrolase [Streptomyces sp. NPDC059002]|uniref:alpha/beta fold hydrolase n=1 Tax=Streptomyces sp. NPDC059002 TaxID=3346690 RepID=UPI00369226AA